MWEHVKFRSNDGSGSLAAAFVVCGTGLFGLAACTLLFINDDPIVPLLVLGAYFASAMMFLWLIVRRGDLPSVKHFVFRSGSSSERLNYQPKLIRRRPATYGTQHPPTAEEIRDLSDGLRNWVPSEHPGPRRYRPQRRTD